jgi:hypothetical protein
MIIEFAPKIHEELLPYDDAVNYCKTLNIDGKYDWRLPTLTEIGYYALALDSFELDRYWLLDDNMMYESKITYDYEQEDVSLLHVEELAFCRPVRISTADVDILSKIEFYLVNICLEWDDARLYCFSLNINGKSGWRLPTIDELDALYLYGSIDSKLSYWSSTVYEDEIMYKNFNRGIREFGNIIYKGINVMAVRDL